jgi:hypothetical protein
MTLEWLPLALGDRGFRSKCGKYSVCSIGDGHVTWEAWKLAPGGPWFAPLQHGLPSEEAAMAVAQADSERAGA